MVSQAQNQFEDAQFWALAPNAQQVQVDLGHAGLLETHLKKKKKITETCSG